MSSLTLFQPQKDMASPAQPKKEEQMWDDDEKKSITERAEAFFKALGIDAMIANNPSFDFGPFLRRLKEFSKPIPRTRLKQYSTFNDV